jgi:hypothetical protein
MFGDPYVIEKLIELEKRRAPRFLRRDLPPPPHRINGVARSLGRAMQRAGGRLEAWAGPRGQQPQPQYFTAARRY